MRLVKLWINALEGECFVLGSKQPDLLFNSKEMSFDLIAIGFDEIGLCNSFFWGNSIFLFFKCGNVLQSL